MGLGGRIVGYGGECSHYGEAYLVQYPVEGGYGFPFAGCALPDRAATSYSSILAVDGTLRYGWTGDRSCPPPGAACSSYAGSSGITLTRLPASLEVSRDPDTVSLDAVPAGHGFTFRGRANPHDQVSISGTASHPLSWRGYRTAQYATFNNACAGVTRFRDCLDADATGRFVAGARRRTGGADARASLSPASRHS